jgi:hypothetical protein
MAWNSEYDVNIYIPVFMPMDGQSQWRSNFSLPGCSTPRPFFCQDINAALDVFWMMMDRKNVCHTHYMKKIWNETA